MHDKIIQPETVVEEVPAKKLSMPYGLVEWKPRAGKWIQYEYTRLVARRLSVWTKEQIAGGVVKPNFFEFIPTLGENERRQVNSSIWIVTNSDFRIHNQ